MLKSPLIHPQILEAVARGGHHSKVVIADGNYPAATTLGPNAKLVSLNLTPGIVSAPDTFRALMAALPVDDVMAMDYEREGQYALSEDPKVWSSYRQIMKEAGFNKDLELVEKWKFYDVAGDKDVVLTIQTADQNPFANLILVMGCVN